MKRLWFGKDSDEYSLYFDAGTRSAIDLWKLSVSPRPPEFYLNRRSFQVERRASTLFSPDTGEYEDE